ncbi:MAG: 30S ribosome-binding factor RbfA [Clostridia bacterium]|nr:30S ribosome-binding factor RbfA [Clostridia bacterium]
MGKGYRQGRLGGEIQKIISELLMTGIKDPRLSDSMVSISTVDVTRDGSYATCYVTVLNMDQDPEKKEERNQKVIEGLNSAKGMIKREIGRSLTLHHIPELIFKIDTSMEYGRHMDEVLNSLHIEDYPVYEESEEDDF